MPTIAELLAAATRLPVPEHTAEDARRAADRILSRPSFREPEPSLVERLRDWVIEGMGRLLARVLEGASGSPLGWIAVALVVTVLVVLAVRFARGIVRDPEHDAVAPPLARRAPSEWRAEASAHEARGDWRAALRCRYRALVADLAARGLVEEVPGRTAGEYRREVDVNVPAVAGDFAGATTLFESVWYGGADAGPGEAERFRSLEDRVLQGAS